MEKILNQLKTNLEKKGRYKMKKVMCTICLIAISLIAGCAGRDAHPTKVHQRGDQSLSCNSIASEISNNRFLITEKLAHDRSKLWSNVWWFIWFPPLMDVKEAEKTEAEALQRRNDYLQTIFRDKNCR